MKDICEIVSCQRTYFLTDATLSVEFRLTALEKLRNEIIKCDKEIADALKSDLNKSYMETEEAEISMVLSEINYFIKNLYKFARPQKKRGALAQFPSKITLQPMPYGVSLIMSPWNYPFQLCLEPLVGAIASGNTAVLKPSNYSPATSDIIAKIIKNIFDEEYITVVLGGREQNTQLLNQKFDYIFFTGGTAVGKLVMESAAKNLTPITLELGGKSPCIIDKTADIALAATRITWGKFLNAGQTCVAPDYFLVESCIKEQFVKEVIKNIEDFYTQTPLNCEHLPKIVNEKHFLRLLGLMKDENIVYGGKSKNLSIEPTILDDITYDSPIMQEEIFGPIMPILTFENISDVISKCKTLPHPLALYLFSNDENTQKSFIEKVNYGGGCINDVIIHLATSLLPFGGVGESGMGMYHGKYSFDTFTHYKSIVHKSNFLDLKVRYLPPTAKKLKFFKTTMRK